MSEWVEINLPYNNYGNNDFVHSDENRAGVFIEMDNGERFLIGDIEGNIMDSGCGCCADTMFENRIVKRYKILIPIELLNKLYNE
jgi:hypothetical protein